MYCDNCLLDFSVCKRESLISKIGPIIYPAMRKIHLKLEEAIDLVKVHIRLGIKYIGICIWLYLNTNFRVFVFVF